VITGVFEYQASAIFPFTPAPNLRGAKSTLLKKKEDK